MRIMLVHNPAEGHSYQIGELSSRLQDKFKTTIFDLNPNAENDVTGIEYDIVILWCAIPWWLKHRAQVKGRPWVCALSWCFNDLMHLTTPGMGQIDAGINTIMTNCAAYVQQSSSAFETWFKLKPLRMEAPPQRDRKILFGSVLPNVEDRDFSLLTHAAATAIIAVMNAGIEPTEEHFRIFYPKNSACRIPDELVDRSEALDPVTLDAMYYNIKYFIPAPRITDYRGGVFPPEIFQAAKAGCKPIVVSHPVIEKQSLGIQPLFRSLNAFDAAIWKIVDAGEDPIEFTYDTSFCESFPNLTVSIQSAYERWSVNATR